MAARADLLSILIWRGLGGMGCAVYAARVVDRGRRDQLTRRNPVAAGAAGSGLVGNPLRGQSSWSQPCGATSLGPSAWNIAASSWIWPRPTPSSDWPPP